jgi:ABC-type amino acid transport/signal transduction systems, periplasmic component/domain
MSKLAVLALFSILVFEGSLSQAQTCDRRFRVAVNAYKPLYSVDRSGRLSGLTYELVKEIEKRVGCIFSQQPSDTPRMFEDFSSYRTDFIAFLAKNDKANSSGNFVPLYTVNRKFVVAKTAFVANKKIEDYIKDPKVRFTNQIGARMFFTAEEYNVLKDSNRVLEIPNPQVAYQMISEGRAQAMFSSPAIHHFHATENKSMNDKVVAVSDPTERIEVGMYISKKRVSASEAAKVKNAIISMRDDGTLKKILLKYVETEDISTYAIAH